MKKSVFDGGVGGNRKEERLVTVGADGRVMQWTYNKGAVEYEQLTR